MYLKQPFLAIALGAMAMTATVPSVRNKVNTTDLNGPSAQPKWLNGKGKAVFTLNFEL